MVEVNEQLAEVISNSQIAFLNGTLQEAFSLYSTLICSKQRIYRSRKSSFGDKLISVNGEDLVIVKFFIEETAESVSVYNFQVEDYHTYFVGECAVWVHNAECIVRKNGEIEITDWEGYPKGGPKPDGKLKLLEGEEYTKARKSANSENAQIHRQNPELKGKQIHEVHPVKFSGSPTNHSNKIALTQSEHAKYTKFWKRIQAQAKNQMK